jgi:hypothetical protein
MALIPITVFVYMGDPTPIEGVRVSIWKNDYSSCVFDDYTNSGGNAIAPLEEGQYHIFLKKDNVAFNPQPKDISVSDTPFTAEYEGIPQNFPPNSNGTVYLYGDCKDLNLNPMVFNKIQVYMTASPQIKDYAILDKSVLEVFTDQTGRWGTILPGGSHVTVIILNSNFQRSGFLPFNGRLNILDLT